MEALVEAALHSDALSLEISNTAASSSNSATERRGLRYVVEKLIPSRHVATGLIDESGSEDAFTGWIDAVTGVLVWGVRHYRLTGEWYEGSFDECGLPCVARVLQNVHLPRPVPAIPDLLGQFRKLSSVDNDEEALAFQILYHGRYRQGLLEYGTLVSNRILYRGTFVHQRFHSIGNNPNCEWIRLSPDDSSGTMTLYRGEFQQGLFHGTGVWQNLREGGELHTYHGQFRNGMKHGQGIYTIRKLLSETETETEPESDASDDNDNNSNNDEKKDDDSNNTNETNPAKVNETTLHHYEEQRKWIEFIMHDAESTLGNRNSSISAETMMKQLEHIFPFSENIEFSLEKHDEFTLSSSFEYYYKGSFYGNARQGEGVEYDKNGNAYRGQLKNNARHGHGCLTTSNGDVCCGKWHKGEPSKSKYWNISSQQGDVYLGQALVVEETTSLNGECTSWKPHGYGAWLASDATQVGTFNDGILQNGVTSSTKGGTEFIYPTPNTQDPTSINIELLENLGEIAETLQVKNHNFPLPQDYTSSASSENEEKEEEDNPNTSSSNNNNSKNQYAKGKEVFGRKILAQAVASSIGTSLEMIASHAEESMNLMPTDELWDDEDDEDDDDNEVSSNDEEQDDSNQHPMRQNRRASLSMNDIFVNKQSSSPVKRPMNYNFSMASLNSSTLSLHNSSSMMSLNSFSQPEFTPESSSSLVGSHSNHRNSNNQIQLHSYANGDMYLGRLQENNATSSSSERSSSGGNSNHYHSKRKNPSIKHRVGVGVHVSRNGSSYIGHFAHHKRHGFGVLRKGTDGKQQYAGTFWDGKKHGVLGNTLINMQKSENVSYYHGGFHQDVLEGKGILVQNSRSNSALVGSQSNIDRNNKIYDIYIGEWKSGQYHGYGIHITTIPEDELDNVSNNTTMVEIYQGYFFHGVKQGKGTILIKDLKSEENFQILYSGQWQNDEYHGLGIERILDSDEDDVFYEGQFCNGEKHGYGVMKQTQTGDCYQGYWNQNHPTDGKWRIQYSNGNLYHGQAQVTDLVPTDKMVVVPKNSSRRNNLKQAAKESPTLTPHGAIIPLNLQGFGTMQYSNGDVYVGEFSNTQRHGLGYGITINQSWEGTWQNDVETEQDGILTLKKDGSIHYKGKAYYHANIFSSLCRLRLLRNSTITPSSYHGVQQQQQQQQQMQYWEQDHIMNLIMS